MLRMIKVARSGFSEESFGPKSFPFFDLLWIHRSGLSLCAGATACCDLQPGQGVLIYPNTLFSGQLRDMTTLASVHHFEIPPSAKTQPWPLNELAGRRNGALFFPHAPHIVQALLDRAIDLSLKESQDEKYEAMQRSYLTAILQELFTFRETVLPSTSEFEPLIQKIRQTLQAPWTLARMSEEVGQSVNTFRGKFAKAHAISPKNFLTNERLETAGRLLRETRDPIKQIAAAVGYPKLNLFYRNFKLFYGTSPARYRKKYLLVH